MNTIDSYLLASNAVVWRKVKDYCRHQPRTHQQVRQKLYGWRLGKMVVEAMLSGLIEEGMVSESRFATAYVHDRLRINRWGTNKVRNALQKRQISIYCIREALTGVDQEQYETNLRDLAEKKWESFHGKRLHPCLRAKKTANFLIGRGFETARVWRVVRVLQQLQKSKDGKR